MKTYQVRITLATGINILRMLQVNDLDDIYACVEWLYPQSRIIGAKAIQRVA
ncbi:MAG: hypothetical protein HY847_19670 [Betaproteobacteria bacterium]|nr:hypothetical protein [Betaproteobacteria bacterium]